MESKEKISKDIKQKPQIPLWYQKKKKKIRRRSWITGDETEEDKNQRREER